MPEIKDVIGNTSLITFFVITAFVILKVFPRWQADRKEIRLAEISVKVEEARAKVAQAEATGKLTDMLRTNSEMLDELKIFLRVATRDHETIHKRLGEVEEALSIRASH